MKLRMKASIKFLTKTISMQSMNFGSSLNETYTLKKLALTTYIIDNKNYFSPENIILKTKRIQKLQRKSFTGDSTCVVRDAEIIYAEAVKHIVRQLSCPNIFDERIFGIGYSSK